MDFSINLGKFSPINPSNTGLHLAYKSTQSSSHSNISSFHHVPTRGLFVIHPPVSHALEACIVDHSGVSKQEPMAYIPHLSTLATSRSGKFQSDILEACILHQMDHFIWQLGKQEPMAYMPQLSIQATSRSRSFRLVYFRLFFLFYLYYPATVAASTCFISSCYPGLSRESL